MCVFCAVEDTTGLVVSLSGCFVAWELVAAMVDGEGLSPCGFDVVCTSSRAAVDGPLASSRDCVVTDTKLATTVGGILFSSFAFVVAWTSVASMFEGVASTIEGIPASFCGCSVACTSVASMFEGVASTVGETAASFLGCSVACKSVTSALVELASTVEGRLDSLSRPVATCTLFASSPVFSS